MSADLARIEAFLIHEARLLDEARYADWLDLFTADAWYWVPSQPGQASPLDTVSLIYDDRKLLETRVRRLAAASAHAQAPPSRTSRIVANPGLEPGEDGIVVRSKVQMIEYRRDKQRLFGGTQRHGLVPRGDGFAIGWKRVDLVNCDSVMDGLSVPF